MHALLALFFFLAPPFWETEQWTYPEIETIRTNSPWAQSVGPAPAVLVYFATAAPIEEAEAELRRRSRDPLHEPDGDYLTFLSENRETCFVLAIPYTSLAKLGKASEEDRLEKDSAIDKRVVFDLSLPGIDFPEREVEFDVKDLMYHGKFEL